MHWCNEAPVDTALARITAVYSGAGSQQGLRYFVFDAMGGALRDLPADAKPELVVTANSGEIRNAVAYRNPENGGWRVAFELAPGDAKSVELRAELRQGQMPLAETWLYRWTA